MSTQLTIDSSLLSLVVQSLAEFNALAETLDQGSVS